MKKIYSLVLFLYFFNGLNAQVINFPDANFKAKLLEASDANKIAKNLEGNYFKIDNNNNGEIEENEVLAVKELNVSLSKIANLSGIEFFINLTYLNCYYNEITNLNITKNVALTYLNCIQNKLTSLNVINNIALERLSCGNNKLAILNLTNNKALITLLCGSNPLKSLDISNNTSLTTLRCDMIQLTSLNVNKNTALTVLSCDGNYLTSLNVSKNILLQELDISSNKLTSIDVSNNVKLTNLFCEDNKLTSLDVSKNSVLTTLWCDKNELTSLFVKNGSDEKSFTFYDNPNLKYICADELQLSSLQGSIELYGYTNCHVNAYCSFSPGGTFYSIQGNLKLDNNNDGCDALDISVPNVKFKTTNGATTGSLISNNLGNYSISVQKGSYTITPILENETYFNISPANTTVTFPVQTSPVQQDFCIKANGIHSDLEISLLPLQPTRPGFDVAYKIVYRNKGNNTQSGSVNLTFDDAVIDFVSANPATTTRAENNLSWNFSNLKPFETREIIFTLNVNSPMETPPVKNGDGLKFIAVITSENTDETPIDNIFNLSQIAVGSYDPNDKTCLEGDVITPNLIGEYVHYMIRFENTGTYKAQNIVVKDMIDLSKFDISTLIPTSSSHSFITKISETNKVEFIFENINLPFDDANNDGYVAFKIKTKPTLKVGDSFTNDANIYFDYNFPILTNKATSTFKSLATQDFDFSNYFTLFPNPAKDILNITTKQDIEIQSFAIYDILGQLVIAVPNAKTVSNIDVSKLRTGNYFIKVKSDKGSSNMKFIKK